MNIEDRRQFYAEEIRAVANVQSEAIVAAFAARFISPVAIFSCAGARDEASNQRLREAMSKGTWMTVQSLRREPHEAAETCWLHGENFCLSTQRIGGASV